LDLADSRDHRGKLVRLEVPVSQEALARVVSRVYSVIPDFQDLPDFQDSPVPLEIKDNKVILEHRARLDFQETKVTNVFGCWFRFGCLLFSQEVDTNLWPVCAFCLCLCACAVISCFRWYWSNWCPWNSGCYWILWSARWCRPVWKCWIARAAGFPRTAWRYRCIW